MVSNPASLGPTNKCLKRKIFGFGSIARDPHPTLWNNRLRNLTKTQIRIFILFEVVEKDEIFVTFLLILLHIYFVQLKNKWFQSESELFTKTGPGFKKNCKNSRFTELNARVYTKSNLSNIIKEQRNSHNE